MKVLFDQGVPVPLKRELSGHEIVTAYEMDWATLENGELIDKAESERFEVFLTTDKNLKYQQSLSDRKIAIVNLPTTNWPALKEQISLIQSSIDDVVKGAYQ